MSFAPKRMDTERFSVTVAYQADKARTHIIFGDKDGVGMRACTFNHDERRQLVKWLQQIDAVEFMRQERSYAVSQSGPVPHD